jgi:hypothetical protein
MYRFYAKEAGGFTPLGDNGFYWRSGRYGTTEPYLPRRALSTAL